MFKYLNKGDDGRNVDDYDNVYIDSGYAHSDPTYNLFSLFLLGMFAARVSFVLMYWSYYSNDWVEMVDLRDGGFLA